MNLERRKRRYARRGLLLAFGVGLFLGAAASGAVVSERLFMGDLRRAGVAFLLVFAFGIVALPVTCRLLAFSLVDVESGEQAQLRRSGMLALQVAGALCGISAIHLGLRVMAPAALTWMSRSPAELVNDAVAVASALTAVWACSSRPLRIDWLWAMLCILLLYRLTTPHWHLDHAPRMFQATVQELVAAQFIALASGLLAFRRFGAA